jgi:hypothetical protein
MSSGELDDCSNGDVYRILGNSRRLRVIRYLSLFEEGTSIEVRQIARAISGIEIGISPRLVGTKDYESVYNGLIQTHLPKLAAEGVIEYDERSKEATVTPNLKQYMTIDILTQFVTSLGVEH